MGKLGPLALVAAMLFTAPAHARATAPAHARSTAGSAAPCAQTQTITIVNQAHIRRWALARVERAVVAQSMQLRDAWGTPCAAFGPGGWRVYLKIGGGSAASHHFWYGQPYAVVWTGGDTWEGWSVVFSHEIVEMLADPTTGRSAWLKGTGRQVEIADPVEERAYRIEGVYVSDFVLPDWFAGATTGDPVCQGERCVFPGPMLAPDTAGGPWDEMHLVPGPWQDAPAVLG